MSRFRGLTASLLLDLTCLASVQEEAGRLSARRHDRRHRRESEEKAEPQAEEREVGSGGGDLRVSHSLDEVKAHAEADGPHGAADGRKRPHEHGGRGHDTAQSEMHAVQLSYLYLGAMKTLSALLSCSKYAELLLIPKVATESSHNSDCGTSPVSQDEVGMRAALQFLMRHMVKRAVMRSPIKRALGLADLERAQAMVYKLVVSGLLEDQFGGKVKPGE